MELNDPGVPLASVATPTTFVSVQAGKSITSFQVPFSSLRDAITSCLRNYVHPILARCFGTGMIFLDHGLRGRARCGCHRRLLILIWNLGFH